MYAGDKRSAMLDSLGFAGRIIVELWGSVRTISTQSEIRVVDSGSG